MDLPLVDRHLGTVYRTGLVCRSIGGGYLQCDRPACRTAFHAGTVTAVGTRLLRSTNPLYVPYEVPINNVLEIWKFVHFISAELPEPNLSRDELTRSVQDLRKEVSQLRLAMEQQGRLAL